MRYAFVGAGNMCSAIIRGMQKDEIFVFDICAEKAAALAPKAKACLNNTELIANADVLVLGVKPNVLGAFLQDHADEIKKQRPLIVSLAAGKTIAFLEAALGADMPIVRVMPNINSACAASVTGFCANGAVTEKHKQTIFDIFGGIGSVTEIADEAKFPVFSAIAAASPAFAYIYIDALARAGQKAGLPREQALQIAAEAVMGSAKMILNSEEHPMALVDRVCSPGGTTIEGVAVLQQKSFSATVTDAVDAVIAKDKKLGQ